jgi:hypothetical protein
MYIYLLCLLELHTWDCGFTGTAWAIVGPGVGVMTFSMTGVLSTTTVCGTATVCTTGALVNCGTVVAGALHALMMTASKRIAPAENAVLSLNMLYFSFLICESP